MDSANWAAVLGERLCGGAALRSNQVAHGLAGKVGLAGKLGEIGVHAGTATGGLRRHDREQFVARSRDVKLELAMLIDRAERTDRCRALAVLAETLGPKLDVPLGEHL